MSFVLPENIYVVTDFECTITNGFAYMSKDRKITVTVGTDNSEESLEEYIKSDAFADNGFKVFDIMQGGYSGLKGTAALYGSETHEYCEIRLFLPHPTADERMFIIFAEVRTEDIPIKEAVKHTAVTELIMSLKKDLSD